jgi:hypothetical protein
VEVAQNAADDYAAAGAVPFNSHSFRYHIQHGRRRGEAKRWRNGPFPWRRMRSTVLKQLSVSQRTMPGTIATTRILRAQSVFVETECKSINAGTSSSGGGT